jgi:hypothetical protein
MKTNNKIPCNACGRRVKDNPQSKTAHILQFHADVPFKRLITFFNPALLEYMGFRLGETLKGML